jgi:hypothetical protein
MSGDSWWEKAARTMERAKGIEPSYAAWEAAVLPLNYAREISGLAHVRRSNKRPPCRLKARPARHLILVSRWRSSGAKTNHRLALQRAA